MSQVGSGLPRLLAERYELVEQLASGSMTSAWRGHDRILGRDVVVKVLHPELAADPDVRASFHQEAVNAARLTHPNIVALYDTGEQHGVNYVVMELVEGRTLRDVLRTHGPLPPARAARLACEVVYALEYAHQAGVVHRNLKPANILLGDDGSVKVADFSIAKAATEEDPGRTGELLAASGYMAPELVDGAEPDGRADVYGLGLCLFEMLTGRPPAAAAAASLGISGPISPRAIRAGVPRELDAVVRRAMAANPNDRFPTAQAMASALARTAAEGGGDPESLLSERTPEPLPPLEMTPAPGFLRHEARWLGWTLVLVGLVAVLIVVGLTLNRSGVIDLSGPREPGPRDTSRTTQVPAAEPLQFSGAAAFDPLSDNRQENNEDAQNAIDGNESTAWKTEHYESAALGGLKAGVGLVLDLGRPERARVLDLQLLTTGADFEIYGARDEAPRTFDEWAGNRLGGQRNAGQNVDVALSGDGSYRYYLVWFTKLPPAPDGDRFQDGIAEASLRP